MYCLFLENLHIPYYIYNSSTRPRFIQPRLKKTTYTNLPMYQLKCNKNRSIKYMDMVYGIKDTMVNASNEKTINQSK